MDRETALEQALAHALKENRENKEEIERLKALVKESETVEQEELIELVSLAFHAMGKIRSEPTMSGTKFYPIPKEYEILSGKFYDKLDAFCGKYRTLVDSITRKPLDR